MSFRSNDKGRETYIMINDLIKKSPLGIGCAYLTAGSLTKYDERLIRSVMEAGATHFDVAPQYGLGTAESVLGKALKGHREKVSIATKVGIMRPYVANYKLILRSLIGPLRNKIRNLNQNKNINLDFKVERNLNFDPTYIRSSLEESLKKLGTDYVNMYMLHMPRLIDITEEVIYTLQELKKNGKVQSIGLATDRNETKIILECWPQIFDVVQYSWSVLDESIEKKDSSPYLITHRALSRAYEPLWGWLEKDQEMRNYLTHVCGADFYDPNILSKALLGAALVENENGQILVASRSIARNLQNIEAVKDPHTKVLGQHLINALAGQKDLPLAQ